LSSQPRRRARPRARATPPSRKRRRRSRARGSGNARKRGSRRERVTHVPFVRGIGISFVAVASSSTSASDPASADDEPSDASATSVYDAPSTRSVSFVSSRASPEPRANDRSTALARSRCWFSIDGGPSSAISRVRAPSAPGPPATELHITHISRNDTVAHVHTRRLSAGSRGRGGGGSIASATSPRRSKSPTLFPRATATGAAFPVRAPAGGSEAGSSVSTSSVVALVAPRPCPRGRTISMDVIAM
jgi:hypothetical protein